MQEENNTKIRTIYLQGRPGAHPVHSNLAASVTSEFRYVDEYIRWQDKRKTILFNFYAWFMNALFFKNRKVYDVFLVDNLHLTFPIMKMLGLLRKNQKIIVHLGSHTLYFMYSGKFSGLNLWMHKLALRKYDALICEGKMAEEIARKILKGKCPPTYCSFLGPRPERSVLLKQCQPDLESNTILIIAAGPEKFREFYKGLDMMVIAFDSAFKSNNQLRLTILGDWSGEIKDELISSVSKETSMAITFTGPQSDLDSYLAFLNSSALCLHCARGDAFPTSTVEAMMSGLPTIVSEWTGTREISEKIDKRLVVHLDAKSIHERILWYFALSKEEKQELSSKSRLATVTYNEEDAVRHYRNIFKKIYKDLNLL